MAIKKHVAEVNVFFDAPERLYGFIHGEPTKQSPAGRWFFHIDSVISGGKPEKGMVARFDTILRTKGAIAVNVELFHTVAEMLSQGIIISNPNPAISANPTTDGSEVKL
jgi:hypothetical protein